MKYPPTSMANIKKANRLLFKKTVTQHKENSSPKHLHQKLLGEKVVETKTPGASSKLEERKTTKEAPQVPKEKKLSALMGAHRKEQAVVAPLKSTPEDVKLLSLNERMARDIDLAQAEKPESKAKLLNFAGRNVVSSMTLHILNRVLGFVEAYRLSKDVSRVEKHDAIMSQKEYVFEGARIRNEQTFLAFNDLAAFFLSTDKGVNIARGIITSDSAFKGVDFEQNYLEPITNISNDIEGLKSQYLDGSISEDDFQRLKVLIDQRNVLMRDAVSRFSHAYAGYLKAGNKQNILPLGVVNRLEMLRGETFSGQKAVLLLKEERMILGDIPTFTPKLGADKKGIIEKIKNTYQKHQVSQKQKEYYKELKTIRTRNYQDAMKAFEAHRLLADKKGGCMPTFRDVHSSIQLFRMGATGVINVLKSATIVGEASTVGGSAGAATVGLSGVHAGLEFAEAGYLLKQRGKTKKMGKIAKEYVEKYSVHKKAKKLDTTKEVQKEKEIKAQAFLKDFYKLSPEERAKMRDLGAIAVKVTRARNVREKDEDIAYHAAKGVIVGASAAAGVGIIAASAAGAATGYGAPIALGVLAGGSIALTTGYISYKTGKAGFRLYQQMQWQNAQKLLDNLKHEQKNLESLCEGFPDIKEMKGKSPFSLDEADNEKKILKSEMYQFIRQGLDEDSKLSHLSPQQKDAIALSSTKLVLIGAKLEEQSRYKMAKESAMVEMKHGLGKDLSQESVDTINANICDVVREHTIHKSDDVAMGVLYDRLKEEERAYQMDLKAGKINIDEDHQDRFVFRNFMSNLGVKDKYIDAVLNSNDRDISIELLKQVVLGAE